MVPAVLGSTALTYRSVATALVGVGVLALPASAGAKFSVALTADGSGTQALTASGLTIGDPSPRISVAKPAGVQGFNLSIQGPDGGDPLTYADCKAEPVAGVPVSYRGNGDYVVKVTPVDVANGCVPGAPEFYRFRVVAGAAIVPPSPVLLSRHAEADNQLAHPFRVSFPLGATPEVTVARGAVNVGPDGKIPGASDLLLGTANADRRTGAANLAFPSRGTYSVFSRARIAGRRFTPWSPPTVVRVVDPFEIRRVRFLDRRGPSYRIAAWARDKKLGRVRVRIYLARGSRQKTKNPTKAREYRRIATVKVKKKGRFTKRFRTHRRGLYRLRLVYEGSHWFAPGDSVTKIRFPRTRRDRR